MDWLFVLSSSLYQGFNERLNLGTSQLVPLKAETILTRIL